MKTVDVGFITLKPMTQLNAIALKTYLMKKKLKWLGKMAHVNVV